MNVKHLKLRATTPLEAVNTALRLAPGLASPGHGSYDVRVLAHLDELGRPSTLPTGDILVALNYWNSTTRGRYRLAGAVRLRAWAEVA